VHVLCSVYQLPETGRSSEVVLILTQNFPPDIGGIQTLMYGLARSALDAGRAVKVMADSYKQDGEFDASSGIPTVRYGGLKPIRRYLKARAAREFIIQHKPTAVFCDSWKSLEYLDPPSGVPIVALAHGMEFPRHPTMWKVARMKRTFAKAHAVVAASRFAAGLASPYITRASTCLCVVNPPISPLPAVSQGEISALRQRYGAPILVGLARLEPRKGFDRVIQALPDLAKSHPGIAFLIGGDGEDKPRLQRLASELGVADRVHFVGRVYEKDKTALLSAADIFTMPTRRHGNSVEGFGIVYAEAAWCGVPSLAGTYSGAGDFIADGITGRLVVGNESITSALADMLSDKNRLAAMGQAARAKVLSTGMWESAFDKFMAAAHGDEYQMRRAAGGDRSAAEIIRNLLIERGAEENGSNLPSAAGPALRVVVGVCTWRRPRMLLHCLEAMALQIVPGGVDLHVVVVDNEAEPNNQDLVHGFAAQCPFPVHYVHERRQGIPIARNAVIDKARELAADWIAFTDDDCWVNPSWLMSLLHAAKRHEADVVYGRREFVLPSTFWAVAPEEGGHAEGAWLRTAATHNVLFSARLIIDDGRGEGLRFDEHLAHGEDTDFFHRAFLRGAKITYSHRAVVFEIVPPERASLRRQVSRAYHYAASRSYFHRRHRGLAFALISVLIRLMMKTPGAIARLTIAPLVWPFNRCSFKLLVLKGIARLVGLAGAISGVLGLPGNPYRSIKQT
jgi:phosphatidyl-myo-inositol dimannoside synthase